MDSGKGKGQHISICSIHVNPKYVFTSPFFQMPCGSSPQHELEIRETCRLVTLQEIWDVVLDDPVVIFCLFGGMEFMIRVLSNI